MTNEERSIYNKKYSEDNKESLKCKTKKRNRTKEGLVSLVYLSQIFSSKRRNHKLPTYSKEMLKEWVFKQTNFEQLYNNWVNSGYKKKLKPSVDRLNDYKGYSFCNIQLITFGQNNRKSHEDRKKGINNKVNKAVLQFTKDGEFVREYHSMQEASRNGFDASDICYCCKGERKTHKGFIWKYKNMEVN